MINARVNFAKMLDKIAPIKSPIFADIWYGSNLHWILIFFHKIFLKKFDTLKNDKLITTFLKKRKIYTLLWNSSWIRNDMVIKFRQSYQFFRMLYSITFFLSQKYFNVSTSLKVSIFFLHWVCRLILSERKGFFYYYQISVKSNQVLPQFLKT